MKNSDNKIILSISIAAYNVEKYLNNAVKSLLDSETYKDFIEIIIVNDGSTDETADIAEKLHADHPECVVVINKENGGYGSTINSSLSVAKGEYFKLLDGDDWYVSSNIANFIDFLRYTDADLVVSPILEMRDDTTSLVDNHREVPRKTIKIEDLKLTSDSTFDMHELAIRTETIRQGGRQIAEKCFYTDAEYAFYCILSADTISRFEYPIYCYRLGVEGQSVSLQGMRKHYKDHPIVANRIIQGYEEYGALAKGAKKEILDICIKNITHNTFRAYMLLENPQCFRHELIQFNSNIKRCKMAYSASNKSRLVYVVRKTHFLFYRLMCNYQLRKYIRKYK